MKLRMPSYYEHKSINGCDTEARAIQSCTQHPRLLKSCAVHNKLIKIRMYGQGRNTFKHLRVGASERTHGDPIAVQTCTQSKPYGLEARHIIRVISNVSLAQTT